MRKIYTLILLTFLGISSAWALTAKIEGAEWKGNRAWSGEHVSFLMDAPGANYDGTWKELDIIGNNVNTIRWTVDQGYILHITGMNFRIGKSSLGTCHFYINGADAGSTGLTTGKNFTYDKLSLGNDDVIEFVSEQNVDLYYVEIVYTISPITYYMAFHANGGDGTMANQAISYDQTVALTTNAFTRNYTFTYDPNGGACDETSASVQFGFEGWASSANGEVVYTDGQQMHNLTHENNRVFDLYAVWTPKTITLPEATNETMLFNGWFDENDQYVGKAGDVITPTKSLNLTAKWAAMLTPMFVLDPAEIAIGETAKLTMDNVTTPTVTIAPEGIVSYNAETGILTGLAAGTVTISISQEASGVIESKEDKLVLTVTKKTPSLSFLLNGIDQLSVIIVQGETATVTFEKESDAEVVVTTVSGDKFASYKDGVLTAGEIGVATFRATLPETDTYLSTYKEFQVDVRKNPVHLPFTMSGIAWNSTTIRVASEGSNSWSGENGIVLGDVDGGGFNWDDKYVILHFEGIPDKLTFEISTDAIGLGQSLGGATNVEWFVKESATANMPNDKIWTESRTDNSFSDTYTVQLQPSTRYILLCYSGNFAGYFRNVQISELKYVQDPEPASINFGTAVIGSGEVKKTVNVNWCNIAPMSVESSNPRFTVSPASFANYDEMGSQEITIAYTHTNEVGPQEGVITISNGNDAYTKTIPVSAETTKRIQTITWNAEFAATGFAMNVGEQYPDEVIVPVATSQSGELITFTSADSDIIEVVDDTILVAKAVGTVEITAHQAGDDEYAAVSDTKEFTVTALEKQSITWEQNLYGLLTTDEPVELTATATSGMEITYTSSNEDVVRIEGNMLIIVGEGETTITAKQAGGKDEEEVEWLAVSQENYVIVRNPASQCNGMSLSVGSLTLKSGSLEKEYALEGFPTSLTFSAKHGTKENGAWGQGATYAALMVDEYTKVDGVWGWKTIFNQVVGTEATSFGPIALDEIATKVRFRTTESGTEHTVSNILVPRNKFMRSDVEFIDENIEANAIWSKQITVSHSNIDLMTVTAKQGLIALNTATLGEGCGDYGDDAFVASFAPMEKNKEYFDTIVITDGKAEPSTIEIPVRFFSTGLNQTLSEFVLPATCLTTATVEIPEVTSSTGLEVVFLSSDSTVAYVENNLLKILKAGTVDIIAYQAGDDKYNEAAKPQTIEIQLTPVQIVENPTASPIGAGLALSASELKGGSASVEGTFRWADPDALVEEGSHSYEVVFIPSADSIYATATTQVEIVVMEDLTTFGEETLYMCEGDVLVYNNTQYEEAFEGNVLLDEVNVYGGDSIVYLTILVGTPDNVELFDTLKVGDVLLLEEDEWYLIEENGEGVEIPSLMPAETYFTATQTLVIQRETVNSYGCDSVIVRHVAVVEEGATSICPQAGRVEQGATVVKELRNGVLYIRREGMEYTVEGLRVK